MNLSTNRYLLPLIAFAISIIVLSSVNVIYAEDSKMSLHQITLTPICNNKV